MKVQIKRLAVLCLAILSWAACMKTENNVEEFFGEKVVLSLCPSGEILEVIDNPLSKAALPTGTLYVVTIYNGTEKYARGVFDDPSKMSAVFISDKNYLIAVKAIKDGVSAISSTGGVYDGSGTLDNSFHYFADDKTDEGLYGSYAAVSADEASLDCYYGAVNLSVTPSTSSVDIQLYSMMHIVTVQVNGFEQTDGTIAFTQAAYLPGTAPFELSYSEPSYSVRAVINTDFQPVWSAISGNTGTYSRNSYFTAEYSSTLNGQPYSKLLLDNQAFTFRRKTETRISLSLTHSSTGVSLTIDGSGEDMLVYDEEHGVYVPEAVDLGLSVKWASFNLGASKPEEYGDYYAWGETEPYYLPGHAYDSPCSDWRDGKSAGYSSDWSSYKFRTSGDSWENVKFSKYNTQDIYGPIDNKTLLDAEDDAAYVNLGGSWRIPTEAEWYELISQCTWTRNDNYLGTGVIGFVVVSKKAGYTDKSIFLPAAGGRGGTGLNSAGSYGNYWSSSLYAGYPCSAWFVYFRSDSVSRDYYYRCYGRSVRPVYGEFIHVTGVSLSPSSLQLVSGESSQLTATVTPANASNPAVKWSSSDTSVATVDNSGLVTAVAPGTATITAETYDGGLTASCAVTVTDPTPAGAVDLGLSVYWATTNLGASSETGYGNYYYFGSWDWDLKQKGSPWRVPTIEEWHELQNNCDIQWTSKGGVNGVLITNAATNKSIFLSAGGYTGYYNDSYYSGKNTEAWYWSSSPTATSGSSCCAMFKNGSMPSSSANNYTMMLVRLVYPK